MSEKTEQPTIKHLRDARKKGQVVKSDEIVSGAQLVALFGYFSFQGSALIENLKALILATLDVLNQPLTQATTHIQDLFLQIVMQFMGGMALLLIVTTVLATIAQTKPLLAWEALEFKLDKLNPIANIKQLVSMKSLFEFLKSVCKVALLSLIFFYLLRRYLASLQFLPLCGIACGMSVAAQLLAWMWSSLMGFYLVLAIADFSFQRRSVMKQLMMSKEDVKREYKDAEGNPELKHERKKMHRDIQSGSLAANISKSTVIVRNPQHIAICLYYQQGETPLPLVLEKGCDARALHIVALAEKAGVPIVEHISVARHLMAQTEIGDAIPAALFEPVAQILRVVMQLDYDE